MAENPQRVDAKGELLKQKEKENEEQKKRIAGLEAKTGGAGNKEVCYFSFLLAFFNLQIAEEQVPHSIISDYAKVSEALKKESTISLHKGFINTDSETQTNLGKSVFPLTWTRRTSRRAGDLLGTKTWCLTLPHGLEFTTPRGDANSLCFEVHA